VAGRAVDQAGAAWLTGPASGRGEHQRVHTVRLVSVDAAGGQVPPGVLGDPVPRRVGGAIEIVGGGHGGGPLGWWRRLSSPSRGGRSRRHGIDIPTGQDRTAPSVTRA